MRSFSGHTEHLDTDLNIVPVIDCFVMLICFLLFTAAFTQLVYLEAKLTSNTSQAAIKSRSELDQFRLIVRLSEAGIQVETKGSSVKKLVNETIGLNNGEYDLKALHAKIVELKTEHPERFSVDIEVKAKNPEAVSYEKLLGVMDAIRHLEEEEYAQLRVAEKKIRNIALSNEENAKPIQPVMTGLGERLLADSIAANTDHKLLFPDIAIIGLD
jgi:biopolymer transport protein ExbD